MSGKDITSFLHGYTHKFPALFTENTTTSKTPRFCLKIICCGSSSWVPLVLWLLLTSGFPLVTVLMNRHPQDFQRLKYPSSQYTLLSTKKFWFGVLFCFGFFVGRGGDVVCLFCIQDHIKSNINFKVSCPFTRCSY